MKNLLSAALLILSSGCASIMHGTTQDVGFSSTPTNAKVTVDNTAVGTTPIITKLSRKDNHIVKMTLDGYQPFEATLTKSVSGWVWGNVVFGGLIGLAVDAISGGLYNLSPNQIAGVMSQGPVPQGRPPELSLGRDGIFITVVLHADPSWQRIGTLQKVGN